MSMSHNISTAEVLTDSDLLRIAPSIFADSEHDSRSDRYAFIPTASIVTGLRKNGFQPVWAAACKTRSPDRKSHGKHMIRFRRDGAMQRAGSVSELALVNSHDGSSSYQLHAGSFRWICANGIIMPDGMCQSIRVQHTGNILDNVIEGSFTVIEEADEALRQQDEWQGITLKPEVQEAFAGMALIARYGASEEDPSKPDTLVTPKQYLRARRWEDRADGSNLAKPDVFHTFQTLQEHAVKGGDMTIDPKTRRRSTARPINGIDQTLGVNKQIAALAKLFADKFGS